MYDEHSLQIPQPLPSQNPTRTPRSTRHALDNLTVESHTRDRMAERDFTPEQIFQTYIYGNREPDRAGEPGVNHYVLNSIGHPGTRRRLVVNDNAMITKTIHPREEIPKSNPGPRPPKAQPSSTAARKKAQLAKKRARSRGDSQPD